MSYDVVSLLTKTPIIDACEVTRKISENDKTLKKKTNPSIDNIMEVLTFILWTTYFRFEAEFTNIGSGYPWHHSIPHCCELGHGGLGQKHYRHSARGLSTEKLDEICGLCYLLGTHKQGREIATTHEHCRSHGYIVFTREDEANNGMPFLDA